MIKRLKRRISRGLSISITLGLLVGGHSNFDVRAEIKHDARKDEWVKTEYSGGNISAGAKVALSDRYSFYVDDNKIYRIKNNGTGKVVIARGNFKNLNLYNGWLFFRKMVNGEWCIYKMREDGTEFQMISNENAGDMIVAEGKVFFKNLSDEGKLYRINTDGRARKKLSDDIVYGSDIREGYIKYDEGYVYYFVVDGIKTVYKRVFIDGKKNENLTDNLKVEIELWNYTNASDGWIYFRNNSGMQRVNMESGAVELIHEKKYLSIHVIGDELYFVKKMGQAFKMNLITKEEELILEEEKMRDFYLYDKWIYTLNSGEFAKRNIYGESNSIMEVAENLEFYISIGDDFDLPSTIKMRMSDGVIKEKFVKWYSKKIDTSKAEIFEVKGAVRGYSKDIELTVYVDSINDYDEILQNLRSGNTEFIIGDEYLRMSYKLAQKIVSKIITEDMSDFWKEYTIVNYLWENSFYDYKRFSDLHIKDADELLAALRSGNEISSEGYSRAAALLFNLAGIEAYCVGDGRGDWNIVKIDDQYYNLEITEGEHMAEVIDSDQFYYENFNVTDEELDRTPAESTMNFDKLIICSDDSYETFRKVMKKANISSKSIMNGKYIVYFYDNKLNLFDMDKMKNTVISEGYVENILLHDSKVYYVVHDESGVSIGKINLNGLEDKELGRLPVKGNLRDMYIDNNKLYLAMEGYRRSGLYVRDLDSVKYSRIADINASEMVVNGDWVYYSNKDDLNRLYEMNLNYKKPIRVNNDSVEELKIVGNKLKYKYGNMIRKYNLQNDKEVFIEAEPLKSTYFLEERAEVIDDNIYISIEGKSELYKYDTKDPRNNEMISRSTDVSSEIFSDSEFLYFGDYQDNLYRYNVESKKKEKIASGYNYSGAADDEYVYYGKGMLYIDYNLKSKNKKDGSIVEFEDKMETFTVADNFIYYVTSDNKDLYRVNKDGKDKKFVANIRYRNMQVIGDKVYYVEEDERYHKSIVEVDVHMNKRVLAEGDNIAYDVFVNDGYLYYSTHYSEVYRVNIISQEEELISNDLEIFSGIMDMWFVGNNLIFEDRSDNKVYRINLENNTCDVIMDQKVTLFGTDEDEIYYVNGLRMREMVLE